MFSPFLFVTHAYFFSFIFSATLVLPYLRVLAASNLFSGLPFSSRFLFSSPHFYPPSLLTFFFLFFHSSLPSSSSFSCFSYSLFSASHIIYLPSSPPASFTSLLLLYLPCSSNLPSSPFRRRLPALLLHLPSLIAFPHLPWPFSPPFLHTPRSPFIPAKRETYVMR